MGREARLTAVALAVLVLGLAGGRAWAQSDSPRYGGTIILAIGNNPSTLNPATTTGVDELAPACKMFNGLVSVDRNFAPQPELAESWKISDGGLRVSFSLRKNVRWHDGKPFTAADVKFTFEEVLSKYHPRAKVALASMKAVETPDPHTAVVHFSKPHGPFLQQLYCQEAAILPRHLYEGTDVLKNPRNREPIGTGPFKFQEWIAGSHIAMVRNDDYWRDGMPYLDKVIVKIIPDSMARILALEAGELDYIQTFYLLKQEVARLAKKPGIHVERDTEYPGNFLLFFNVRNKPLSDNRVRHALAMAINRDQIVEQVVYGLGYPGRSAIDSRIKWAHNPEVDYRKLYAYDPARANRLLDEAGYARGAGGVRMRLRLLFTAAQAGFPPMADIIRSNLQEVGVQVVLEPSDAQVTLDRAFNKFDFDLTILPYTTAGDPAIGIARVYVTNDAKRPFTNPTGYSNPRVDELFAQGASVLLQAERRRSYLEVQKILAEDLPTLVLVERIEVDVVRDKFRGIWTSIQPMDQWDRVWWTGGRPKR
jgi:peptide/nickel transport system substrate-binding protein